MHPCRGEGTHTHLKAWWARRGDTPSAHTLCSQPLARSSELLLLDDDVVLTSDPSRLLHQARGAVARQQAGDVDPWLTASCETSAWNATCASFEYGRFPAHRLIYRPPRRGRTPETGPEKSPFGQLSSWLSARLGTASEALTSTDHMWNFGVSVLHVQACR